jgi:hypothetical protein
MKTLALSLAALLTSTMAAYAGDPFASAYGNTVVQTINGHDMKTFVNPDKTWETHQPDGSVSSGTYAWKDANTVCFTATSPPPSDPSQATKCNAVDGSHKVGDSWTVQLPNGGAMTMSLKAGR